MSGIATLLDVARIERTPLAERGIPLHPIDVFERSARKWPDREALRFFLTPSFLVPIWSWTYAELLAEIDAAAKLFRSLGVRVTDTVSIILPNLPEAVFAFWGAQAVGIAHAVNPMLEVASLEAILREAKPSVVVTLGDAGGAIAKKIRAAVAAVGSAAVVEVDPRTRGPLPHRARAWISARGSERTSARRWPTAPTTVSGERPWSRISADRVCALFGTGGTTGSPKLAKLTGRNQTFSCWAAAQTREEGALGPGKVMLTALPLFHTNAALVGGLLPWMQGGTVLLAGMLGYRDRALVERFWSVASRHGVSAMSAVPTVYGALLERVAAGGGASGARLDFAVCGAAPMPVAVFRRFEEATGVGILEGYGLTETSNTSAINPGLGQKRIGSVGLRIPYQPLAIADTTAGNISSFLPAGRVGRILVRGPNVFAGYVRPEHDAWVRDAEGNRWFDTGDLGRLDADGYLWLTGRAKELIIRGGHNLDPRVIEDALASHPDVASCAAVGRPDAHAGELPAAYVSLRPGSVATVEALLAHARASIGERAAVPVRITVLPALPLTPIGKVRKRDLVHLEVLDVVRAALAEAGVVNVDAEARDDAERGLVVRLRGPSPCLRDAARSLERYAFACELISTSEDA